MPNPYEQDFHAWSQEQARKIREGNLDIDREHIAEELESLGKSQQSEIPA